VNSRAVHVSGVALIELFATHHAPLHVLAHTLTLRPAPPPTSCMHHAARHTVCLRQIDRVVGSCAAMRIVLTQTAVVLQSQKAQFAST
jgi:hypothetical protein